MVQWGDGWNVFPSCDYATSACVEASDAMCSLRLTILHTPSTDAMCSFHRALGIGRSPSLLTHERNTLHLAIDGPSVASTALRHHAVVIAVRGSFPECSQRFACGCGATWRIMQGEDNTTEDTNMTKQEALAKLVTLRDQINNESAEPWVNKVIAALDDICDDIEDDLANKVET